MVEYPIKCWHQKDEYISELRCKRLLLLAQRPMWHKRFYHHYYYLVYEGLINWHFGTAFLTDKGKKELDRLMNT